MGEGRRRSARRLCLAVAAVCALLAVAAPALAQDEGTVPPPEVWRGAASAGVMTLDVNRDGLLPVEDVLRFVALDGDSVYETDNQTARASFFYPGEGLLQGPSLLCGTFGGMFPPELEPVLDACLSYDYPLTVKANSSKADANTTGAVALGQPSDPISAEAAGAQAHAAADGSSTAAQLSDLRVLGLPAVDITSILPIDALALDPTIVRIGSATSTTDQRIDRGVLVVTAESKLSGVALVGGLVRIGAIRSTSTATDDGRGRRRATADLEVSGVTVGGFPAQITEDGLVLGTPTGGLGPIQQQVQQLANQLLRRLGVRLSVLEEVESTDDGTGLARAQAPGLLLEVSTALGGLPPVPGPLGDIDLNGDYVGTILIGTSGAAAGASNFEDEVMPPVVDVPVAGATDGSSGSDDSTTVGDATVVDAPEPTGEAAPAPAPADAPPVLTRVVDTFGGRLGLLYLAFAFAVLGLCIVPRLAVPARLPGPAS